MTTARFKVSVLVFATMAIMAPVWSQNEASAKTESAEVSSDKSAPVSQEELDGALKTLEGYDFGKERAFLLTIDSAIRQSAGKEKRRNRLADALAERAVNDSLTYAARDLAMRRLAEIGKGEQVRKLEPLLTSEDEKVAESARRTIASIPVDQADKVLQKALKTTKGKMLLGIIDALGQRGTKGAVKELTEIARQDNSANAGAAMIALGKIGNGEAGHALLDDIRPPDTLHDTWFIAMNEAAASLMEDNKKLAGRLFDRVLEMGGESPARLAAFKGKALLEEQPEAMALKALDDGDAGVAQVAREMLVRGDDPSITSQLLQRLDASTPEKQVTVVEILGARGDKTALEPIMKIAGDPDADETLRVAALSTLEVLGDENSVPLLVKVAAEEKGSIQKTAERSLAEMPVPEADTELLRITNEADAPAQKVTAIEAVAARKSKGAMPSLTKAAGNDDPKVAAAAFKAMTEVGTADDLGAILGSLTSLRNEKVLHEASRTASAIAKDSKKLADAVTQVQAAYDASDNDDVKAALISTLGNLGGSMALKTLQANLGSGNEKLKDAAVRALADYPDARALDDLMKITSDKNNSEVHRVLALRGAVRMLAKPSTKASAQQLETAKRALELATGVEQKKAVIGALADLKIPGVLAMIVPLLDDEQFHDESAAAIIKQAPVANQFDPQNTAELLNPLKEKLTSEQWNKLEEILTPGNKNGGAVRAYQASKTYTLDGETSVGGLLIQEFEPEVGEGDWPQAIWASEDDGDNKGKANLKNYYADTKDVVVYMQAHVWSPEDRKARLDTGSDDGLRVWWNNERVFAHDNTRSFGWWSDETPIQLKRGWNTLLLKVGQGGSDWAAAARIVDENGKPFDDLKYSARPQN